MTNKDKHTNPKKLLHHPNKPKNKDDSKTKVHFSEFDAYKYMSGERKPITIRIDSGLYKRFKPLSKRVWGSVCRAIELYMVSAIDMMENKVHLSHTINKPINIEKIVIERNLRPRRKLEVRDDAEDLACHYCGKSAVGDFRYLKTGLVYSLCDFHAKANLKSKNWEEVIHGE